MIRLSAEGALVAGVVAILLGGCATGQFVQAEKTETEIERDYQDCVTEVDRLYGWWEFFYREVPRRLFLGPPSTWLHRCMERKGYQYVPQREKLGPEAPSLQSS